MKCIYFGENSICYVNPSKSSIAGYYKPEEETKKDFRENKEFRFCPRYAAINEHMQSQSQKIIVNK